MYCAMSSPEETKSCPTNDSAQPLPPLVMVLKATTGMPAFLTAHAAFITPVSGILATTPAYLLAIAVLIWLIAVGSSLLAYSICRLSPNAAAAALAPLTAGWKKVLLSGS